jgi:hypothetical protein
MFQEVVFFEKIKWMVAIFRHHPPGYNRLLHNQFSKQTNKQTNKQKIIIIHVQIIMQEY